MSAQFCPICKTSVPPSERYPNYICTKCVERAVDAENRPVRFYNTYLSGGYKRGVIVNAKTEQFDYNHNCWIDGKPCYVDEAHLGGIVATPLKRKWWLHGLIIIWFVLPAIAIPYLMLLIEAEHWLNWNQLSWAQQFTLLPPLVSALRITNAFIQRGTPILRQALDRSSIDIAITMLTFIGLMMGIGILEWLHWIAQTTVDAWSYALFYGFLGRLFYFAFIELPLLIALQPKRSSHR